MRHDSHSTNSPHSTDTVPSASAGPPSRHRRSVGRLLLAAVGIALVASVAPACAAAPPAPATTPTTGATAQRIPVVSCRHGHPREAPSTSHCRLRIVVIDVPIR